MGLTCSSECSLKRRIFTHSKYRNEHRDYYKAKAMEYILKDPDYNKKCHQRYRDKPETVLVEKEYARIYAPIKRNKRREHRKMLYDLWGRCQDWNLAESKALDILGNEAYHPVILVTEYFRFAPFDIIAYKNKQCYVFQITTRTHTTKKIANRFAIDLALIHKALFISLCLKKYIIKDFSPKGSVEINSNEVEQALKFVS